MQNNDLISRSEVINIVAKAFALDADAKRFMKNVIDRLPAVKVESVRPGQWWDKGSLSCRCSEFGCKSTRESAFCPNCGAKMDAKEE